MKQWIVGPLSVVTLTLAGMPAMAEKPTAQDFETRYERRLVGAAETGTLMYRLDRAAWVATDEVMSRDRRARRDKRMRGYIVDESDGATRVLFVGTVGDTPKALYEVAVKDGRVVRDSYRRFKDGRELTEHQSGLYTALDTARTAWTKEKLLQCAEHVNIIVYRLENDASEGGSYRVYFLSATSKPDAVIAGGHHRIEVNAAADEVTGIHSFTNSCLNLSKKAGPKGATVAGLFLTHLKTPHPEEIHVFLSLNYGLEFFIMTVENEVGWEVDGSTISARILPDDKAGEGSQ